MSVRVLLVDDTEHVRSMLVHVMALHGFEVVGEAASGIDAISMVGAAAPDVVVMDYKMPAMDGLETAQQIRERHPEVAVILYSAYVSDELAERADAAGIAVCVPKSEGVEALGREIAAVAVGLGPG